MTVETPDERPTFVDEHHFLQRLTLTRVDRDIFTGWCHAGAPLRAFGGQVAAQALVAAGTTVEQPGRTVHSLHGYFLRAGRTSDHIVYVVDRPRDGRSFSTRRVKAVQYGETIFAMSASFASPQQGPHHQSALHSRGAGTAWIDLVPDPESLPRVDILAQVDVPKAPADEDVDELALAGFPEHEFIDLRWVPGSAVAAFPGAADEMAWVRSSEHLPDTSLIHVCAITYFSDLSLVGTVLGHHGGRQKTRYLDVASIDHAVWFHHLFRADKWLLFVTDSPISGHGHGFARGQFYDRGGRLVASAAQEVLIRER